MTIDRLGQFTNVYMQGYHRLFYTDGGQTCKVSLGPCGSAGAVVDALIDEVVRLRDANARLASSHRIIARDLYELAVNTEDITEARSEIVQQARELRELQLERDRIAAHEAILQSRLANARVHESEREIAERKRWRDALSLALGASVFTPEQAREHVANLVKIREGVSALRTLSALL